MTANDKLDALEKAGVSLLEAAASCCLLAGTFLSEKPDDGSEVDLDKLMMALKLATASTDMLLAAVFYPMAFTVYNSFITPLVQFKWGSEANTCEVLEVHGCAGLLQNLLR